MTQTRLNRVFQIVALGALSLLACTGGGCSRIRASQAVTIENAKSVSLESAPLAIDVQNTRGTVSVWVAPNEPMAVWAAVRGGSGSNHKPDWVAATMAADNGRPVLRVLATAPEGEARETTLRIRVPSCGGIRVRNADGLVDLKGVSGAIDVQNSMPFGTPLAIRIAAGAPITAPLGAHTNNGSIDVRLPIGSTGTVKVHCGDGTPIVDGGNATLTKVVSTRTDLTCVIDGGENDISISTDRGTASLLIGR